MASSKVERVPSTSRSGEKPMGREESETPSVRRRYHNVGGGTDGTGENEIPGMGAQVLYRTDKGKR